jgi:hypothetical protein
MPEPVWLEIRGVCLSASGGTQFLAALILLDQLPAVGCGVVSLVMV